MACCSGICSVFTRTRTRKLSAGGRRLDSRRNSQHLFATSEQTVIIFDWDDTLFPTTYFQGYTMDRRPLREQHDLLSSEAVSEMEANLAKCSVAVERLLRAACALGRVVIVTLAFAPWVTESCANFMPSVGALLKELQIRVVYARSGLKSDRLEEAKLAKMTPAEYDRYWGKIKGAAIERELRTFYTQYDGQSWKNVISIGDSESERFGTEMVADKYKEEMAADYPSAEAGSLRLRTKIFKLLAEPGIDEILMELRLVMDWLGPAVLLDDDLSVDFDDITSKDDKRRIDDLLSGIDTVS